MSNFDQFREWESYNLTVGYPFTDKISSPEDYHTFIGDALISVNDHDFIAQKDLQLVKLRVINLLEAETASSSSSSLGAPLDTFPTDIEGEMDMYLTTVETEAFVGDDVDPTEEWLVEFRIEYCDAGIPNTEPADELYSNMFYDTQVSEYQTHTEYGNWLIVKARYRDRIIKLLIDLTKTNYYTAGETFIENAIFLPSVIDRHTKKVTSITADLLPEILINDVVFDSGYNISILDVTQQNSVRNTSLPFIEEEEVLPKTFIQISAIPGAGLGKFKSCEDDPLIKEIDGTRYFPLRSLQAAVRDDRGNINLNAEECFWTTRPGAIDETTFTPTPNTLALRNNCYACCTCDDYAAVYEAMRVLVARLNAVNERLKDIRDRLNDIIDDWEARRACSVGLTTQLRVTPRANRFFTIDVIIGNNKGCDLPNPGGMDTDVRVKVECLDGTNTLVTAATISIPASTGYREMLDTRTGPKTLTKLPGDGTHNGVVIFSNFLDDGKIFKAGTYVKFYGDIYVAKLNGETIEQVRFTVLSESYIDVDNYLTTTAVTVPIIAPFTLE